MSFVRLPVNIWRRRCVCNIFLRQSNRPKIADLLSFGQQQGNLYRPTIPLVCLSFCLSPGYQRWCLTPLPGVSPESCWECRTPRAGYRRRRGGPQYLSSTDLMWTDFSAEQVQFRLISRDLSHQRRKTKSVWNAVFPHPTPPAPGFLVPQPKG